MATLRLNSGDIIKVSPKFKEESDLILEDFEEDEIIPVVESSITVNSITLLDNFVNNIDKEGNNESILSRYPLENIVTLYSNAIYFLMDAVLNILMKEMVYRLSDENIIQSYKNNNVNVKEILNGLDLASQYELLDRLRYNYSVKWKLDGDYKGSSQDLNIIIVENDKTISNSYSPRISKEIRKNDQLLTIGVNDLHQIVDMKYNEDGSYKIINNTTGDFIEYEYAQASISRDGTRVQFDSEGIYSFPNFKVLGYTYSDIFIAFDDEHFYDISPNFNYVLRSKYGFEPDEDDPNPPFFIINDYGEDSYLALKSNLEDRYISLDHIGESYQRVLNMNYKDRVTTFEYTYSVKEDLLAITDQNDSGTILGLIINTKNGDILHEIVIDDQNKYYYIMYPDNDGVFIVKYTKLPENNEVHIYYMFYDDKKLISIAEHKNSSVHFRNKNVFGMVGNNKQLLLRFIDNASKEFLVLYQYRKEKTLDEIIKYIMK